MVMDAAIAMNRFGLGARPRTAPPTDVRRWLSSQLEQFDPAPPVIAAQPGRAEIAASFRDYQQERRDRHADRKEAATLAESGKPASDPVTTGKMGNILRIQYAAAAYARTQAAVESNTDFPERLVHFWANHFAVSVDKQSVLAMAGNFEFEAIRPNILGKFSDLLIAAVTHPAMLLYLDQAQSIGPNGRLAARVSARRNRAIGLNENLAREILELHTLGVRSGYAQADVTEFARALTGHTVAGMVNGPIARAMVRHSKEGDMQFVAAIHEPGERQIIGRRYRQGGAEQARAILSDLATHPATAKHVASKLAQHFVADAPASSLVAKLEQSFLDTGGNLSALYRTLIEATEAWQPLQAKFKSPWDWVISSLRALETRQLVNDRQTVSMFTQMGQPIWRPGSPAGFGDTAKSWAGGAALMRRVEIASRLAERSASRVDARALAPLVLPGQIGKTTSDSIGRAESPAQGLALMLLSPEFLRR